MCIYCVWTLLCMLGTQKIKSLPKVVHSLVRQIFKQLWNKTVQWKWKKPRRYRKWVRRRKGKNGGKCVKDEVFTSEVRAGRTEKCALVWGTERPYWPGFWAGQALRPECSVNGKECFTSTVSLQVFFRS